MNNLVERRDESMLTPQVIKEQLKELMIDNYIARFETFHEQEEIAYSMFSKSDYLSEIEQKIKVNLLTISEGMLMFRT